MEQLTIGQVAERTGLATSTLRYYEERGLVQPVARTEAGYRLYDERSLDRLAFITRAKELGCTLSEIVELAALWESEACGPVQARLHALVSTKITDARRRTVDLIELTAQLQNAAAKLDAPPVDGPCGPGCACLQTEAGPAGPVRVTLGRAPAGTTCTLPADQVDTRLATWHSMLAHVTHRQQTDDGGLRLALDTMAPVDELARLTLAEQGCCSFFAFTITVDQRGVALEVRAPADAAALVTAVFGSTRGDAEPNSTQIS